MTYAATTDVAAYAPNLTDDGDFTLASIPTKAQVQAWLNRGYSRINMKLAGMGYTVPATSGTDIYEYLVDLEALYAAARADMARLSARVGAGERSRGQVLMEQFEEGLKGLEKMDLSRAGLTADSQLYVGGISKSDKAAVEADSDRVAPRFSRGQFRSPGTQRPATAGTDTESG